VSGLAFFDILTIHHRWRKIDQDLEASLCRSRTRTEAMDQETGPGNATDNQRAPEQ
jgi:hypothetical protein